MLGCVGEKRFAMCALRRASELKSMCWASGLPTDPNKGLNVGVAEAQTPVREELSGQQGPKEEVHGVLVNMGD